VLACRLVAAVEDAALMGVKDGVNDNQSTIPSLPSRIF